MNNRSVFILALCFIATAVIASLNRNESSVIADNIWEGYERS
jgi:hypothetical protein